MFWDMKLLKSALYKCIPDILFVKFKFYRNFGYQLNLKSPRTFNEKLNWLRLYDKHENWNVCADKFLVREFVKERIGEQYLIPLLGVYERGEQINFDDLPKAFVLKANHGSGWNIICMDKDQLDRQVTIGILNKYLHQNYYLIGREIQYKKISPKIVCEKFIGTNGVVPEDYKFFCFHGVPHFIQIDENRQSRHTRVIYDTNWNLLPIEYGYPKGEQRERPERLEEMLKIVSELSKNEIFARIDLYVVNQQIYFGEITFTPGNAIEKFIPSSIDLEWGNLIHLPL